MENPSKEVCEKFGIENDPVYVGYIETWSMAIDKDTPVYAVYYAGTNALELLKNKHGVWDRVYLSDITNVHGLVWRLVQELASYVGVRHGTV